MLKSPLVAVHVLTRDDSFEHVMRDGRLLPLEMRKDPEEIVQNCLVELEKWKPPSPGIRINRSSLVVYRQLVAEYKTYLESVPRWHTPKDVETHTNCMDLLAGDGEFVFLSFMYPHPWIEHVHGILVFDAIDLVDKGARVAKLYSGMSKPFRDWLYSDNRWSVGEAKEELLSIFQWAREREMVGERAANYLRRMADSKNAGFIEIMWKGPLPINWAIATQMAHELAEM
jgi:hypothetical protein